MAQNYQLHTVFPTCLYVADVENGAQINDTMLPHIYAMRDHDMANIKDPELLRVFENDVWTTFFSRPGAGLIDESWTNELQLAILHHAQQFASMLKMTFGNRTPRVTTLFANIHDKPYHRHDAHTHPGSVFSGSYFVKAFPGAGKFRLVNPNRVLHHHEYKHTENNELNVNEVALDPVPGRMVMFQSHVPHSVDRPVSDGERIAVAFNVEYL